MATDLGLSEEDFDNLGRIKDGYPDPDLFLPDPADGLPNLSGEKITREKVGNMIVDYAEEHDDDFGFHLCLAPALPEEDEDAGE